ncbi:MAG TPA: SDR family NAD(P)-dependent oxidoreductase [Thermoanaerobaculia bacterium]|nr:SDR family NAD(P)-dependent oxidoreductase [Thermoanaerobaculia bacterium]
MEDTSARAVAVVGVGAIMPGAPSARAFWENITSGAYGISEVDPKRWDPALYWDPDPKAPRKTYSKIGGWVREFPWEPVKWRLPIPPLVEAAMDDGQKWAIALTREVLADFGYPERPLDLDRTAVILGNAMGGEKHYQTAFHIFTPEVEAELLASPAFAALPADVKARTIDEMRRGVAGRLPDVTEDTMPGELSNCIAGRVANLFNFHGANYVTDAACASALAAMSAAVDGLVAGKFDAVLTGGLDRNMGPTSFVKFCKIGALSATGSRPYADGADGFVMGEGAAFFLLKRLADAERDGDRIYAVIRGIGASSDGRGKGITAPNPVGQRFALRHGWQVAGLDPATCSYVEGHGTSTKVGDVVEVESLIEAFGAAGLPAHSIPLGSVKSNIGHLKAGAGAAGFFKAAMALAHKVVPPSLNFERPNPNLDWSKSPFYVNTELREWAKPACGVRRAGLSAFGFGGTNFHVVLEEHVPGTLTKGSRPAQVSVPATPAAAPAAAPKSPLRGALLVGAADEAELAKKLHAAQDEARQGRAPEPAPPSEAALRAPERVAIDFGNPHELAEKIEKALKALAGGKPAAWRPLRGQGIFRGHGPAPKVAFLFTGQGSQYVNMARTLRDLEPIVAETFAQADRRMEQILGRTISSYIFFDTKEPAAIAAAEEELKQTSITQPAVLTTDIALGRLLNEYGIAPDMVMGHSLGEYGALVTAGVLPLEDALEAVAARGREMSRVSVADNGTLAAVFAPVDVIEKTLEGIEGYVVVANYNSNGQSVIGGSTASVAAAVEAFKAAGITTAYIPVSHAFHTKIVEPATVPFRTVLERLRIGGPKLPVVANVTGDLYPTDGDVRTQAIDLLSRQIASPVRFVRGLERLYEAGVRVFVEVGPKRAVQGFVEDVLGHRPDVHSLATNHPRLGDVVSFNQAICGFWAAGIGTPRVEEKPRPVELAPAVRPAAPTLAVPAPTPAAAPAPVAASAPLLSSGGSGDPIRDLGLLFSEFLEKGMKIHRGEGLAASATAAPAEEPVVITGSSLGLPGRPRMFQDDNVAAILRGDQFIGRIPEKILRAMATKHITRLVKSEHGESRFEEVTSTDEVIKLAGRAGELDLAEEFGVPAERIPALDVVTQLAIAAGLEALHDAGIPLVMRYKTTTKGTKLPERWVLPEALQDDTGIVFASAFPGYDSFAERLRGYFLDHERRERLTDLEALRATLAGKGASAEALAELDGRIADLKGLIEREHYTFDRRFLFQILSMGHSQFAELIGARGPNTQVNAACSSTTQAVTIAEDWIRAGRARRVLVIAADDATSDQMMEWIGAGFVATGAAALDEKVEDAALPFDRRRHGMVIGMGAIGLVVEGAEAARERGITPACRLLSAVTANSAFHGTRLDVNHISQVMETLVSQAERKWGVDRHAIAPKMIFVSHETYTPARGGSASAEIFALRGTFGASVDSIVMANTKGFTGHPMAVGIEDALAVKMLETGIVPPIPNFREVDPELGPLHLSKGGRYDRDYTLRLAAGFGSQIAMTLLERVPPPDGRRRAPEELGYAYRIHDAARYRAWLSAISGYDAPDTEVEKRTFRVKNTGAPARASRRLDSPAAPATSRTAAPAPAPAPVPVPAAPVVAPSAPAPAVVPARAPVAAAAAIDPVAERVLAIVAEKTGYAQEMLALDLDLEADLGIDTVKQAELFSAVREEWGIPRDDSRKLRDYPTLKHVIQFVRDGRPDLPPPGAGVPAPAAAPAPAPAAAPAVVAPTPAAPAVDQVLTRVLAIVTEKTGYPVEMLDPELDLEADLGVDTVKQAELFSAVREEYGIPRDDSRKLRDYPTLALVVRFVHDNRPDLAAAAATPAASVTPTPAPASDPVLARVLAIVTEKTGYPSEMLDPELDLEADLGVDTVKQAELFSAVREEYGIPRDDSRKLRDYPTLGHVVQFVYDNRPDLSRPAAAAPAVATTVPTPIALAVAPSLAPVPTQAASASSAVPSPQPAGPASDGVLARVLAIVTEKTGYPAEMLDPELDLEADLGVDTVKQAELFSAVREEYGIPRDDSRKLRDYPTLGHVVRFVYDNRPDLAAGGTAAAPAAPAPDGPSASVASAASRSPLGSFAEAAKVPRRVVVPVVRPALPACKATGVALGAGARVAVMFDRGGAAEALVERLRSRGADVLTLEHGAAADALAERLAEWTAGGPVHGLFWLPALDAEGDLRAMDLAAFREALRVRVKSLYTSARALYGALGAPGTFLVSATRLGGRHGYDAAGAVAPLGGAVSGFTKAFKREKTEATVKVVDFGVDAAPSVVADLLIEEALRDPGCVEVGYADGLRTSVGMRELPVEDGTPGMPLGRESVFLVTGAAGSIVSAITTDLAAASGGTFHLLDLLPEPDRNDPDLARVATDRDALKKEIFERLKAKGERATPALVEKELTRLERLAAALDAIRAVEAAGGTVHWYAGDLRDTARVREIVSDVLARSPRVDVLLHGAGLEISRFLVDKEPKEFDLVFDVKADGFFNLLSALGETPIAATVAFSSVAGRFGNGGQTDYSSANDLLCKLSSSFRTTRPGTRGIALDWTAWGDIGMATRGSIPKMMELAGIDMLPAASGIPIIRRELVSSSFAGEIVEGLRLGILTKEWDETGGLDPEAAPVFPAGPMTGRLAAFRLHAGLLVETELDPKAQPFLFDHRIDGTAVLPGVMGIEAFAEAAVALLPGFRVSSVEDVDFLAPFKLYRDEPRSVVVEAVLRPTGDAVEAECRLVGRRVLPGQAEPQETVHFRGRVRLDRGEASTEAFAAALERPGAAIAVSEIYSVYFHGPAYQVLEGAWKNGSGVVGLFADPLPPNHIPDAPTVVAPRLVELAFQTAGVYELGTAGRMGLPLRVERVRPLRPLETGAGRLHAVVTPSISGDGSFDARVVDADGNVHLVVEGYRTVELPGGAPADRLAPFRDAMA